MSFQIEALSPDRFARYFRMDDDTLARHRACRMLVTDAPGTPCRVSLQDARIGETVLLVNFCHQPARSPYRASHAIFVREGAVRARPAVGHVPEMLRQRQISLRAFDSRGMMVGADVVPGTDLAKAIPCVFARADVAALHLHFAKPGCFAASVGRA